MGGERTTMYPGDFIITPSWAWHDHGNEGIEGVTGPVVWLNGLDIPMVRFFDAGFAENESAAAQQMGVPEGHSLARFGHNMVPVRHSHTSTTSPIFSYSYVAAARRWLPCLGTKIRTPGWATSCAHQPAYRRHADADHRHLPSAAAEGIAGTTHWQTDGAVYSVVEGHGTAEIAGECFPFGPRDTFSCLRGHG